METARVLNERGTVAEMLDAFPYGSPRLDVKAGGFVGEKNKYAQTQYDASANLNYAQARYQDPMRGQFISQDPVFWTNMNIANPQSVAQRGRRNQRPRLRERPDRFPMWPALPSSAYAKYPDAVIYDFRSKQQSHDFNGRWLCFA
jgi:RHS repeat-associated protein